MNFDIEDVLKFNIKDIKSWSNRHDVKVGAEGYFFNKISDLHDIEHIEYSKIERINDNQANCFSSTAFYGSFSFFLPLNAVKKIEAKSKYRPFKSIRELTEIVYNKGRKFRDNISVGSILWVRSKGDENFHQNILITSLGYRGYNNLISINGKSMQEWLDNFELRAHQEWVPFGVQKND